EAASLSFPARPGRAASPGAARLTVRSPVVTATTANATRTNVAVTRRIRPLFCISRTLGLGIRASRFRHAAPAAPQPHHAENDGGGCDDDRDQRDVEEFEPGLQPPDVAAHRCLHLAQSSPGLQHVCSKLLDRLCLLRR